MSDVLTFEDRVLLAAVTLAVVADERGVGRDVAGELGQLIVLAELDDAIAPRGSDTPIPTGGA